MKMLERVKFGAPPVPLKHNTSTTPSTERVKSSQESIQRLESRCSPEDQPRHLQRITTIQNSQIDEIKLQTTCDSRTVPLNDIGEMKPSPEKIESSQAALKREQGPSPKPRPRRLRRINTIQDSQVDDIEFQLDTPLMPLNTLTGVNVSPVKVNSSQRATEVHDHSCPTQQPRRLCKTIIIQDSQVDDSDALTLTRTNSSDGRAGQARRETSIQNSEANDADLGSPSQVKAAPPLENHAAEESSQYDVLQSTFDQTQFHTLQSTDDPAYSALDRDAARFGWTQTQAPLDRVDEDDEESETDDEDLDAGCRPRAPNRVMPLDAGPSQQSTRLSKPYCCRKPAKEPTDERLRRSSGSKPTHNVDTAYEWEDQTRHDVVRVPSSPPPLPTAIHPSQSSTVVPTQFTQQKAIPHQPDGAYSTGHVAGTRPLHAPMSPEKSYSIAPEMISSSPLPLPPWSSPRNAFYTNTEVPSQKTGPESDPPLQSLVDFSLPPPPPPPPRLSSARSGR